MGFNDFARDTTNPLCFRVTNVNVLKKTLSIFHHPLPWSKTIDLMQQRGIGEQDIKTALLKGVLKFKLLAGDIIIECSDIDLITFNNAHKAFLISSGVTIGFDTSASAGGPSNGLDYALKYSMDLIGVKNSKNQLFTTPDKFIYGARNQSFFRPQVFHNGVLQYDTIDYVISKSVSSLDPTLNDQITFISKAPLPSSKLQITYAVPLI